MRKLIAYISLINGFTISIVAGTYSVIGLADLFSGAYVAVLFIVGLLEFSKVVITSLLHISSKQIPLKYKIYLNSSLIVLMCITSAGIYGKLSKGYQNSTKDVREVQRLKKQESKIISKLKELKSKEQELIREGKFYTKSYMESSTSVRNTLKDDSKESRRDRYYKNKSKREAKEIWNIHRKKEDYNNSQINKTQNKLDTIQDKIYSLESNLTSETGTLMYLSEVTGLTMNEVVNYLIIVMVLVFDPLAIVLISTGLNLIQKKNIST